MTRRDVPSNLLCLQCLCVWQDHLTSFQSAFVSRGLSLLCEAVRRLRSTDPPDIYAMIYISSEMFSNQEQDRRVEKFAQLRFHFATRRQQCNQCSCSEENDHGHLVSTLRPSRNPATNVRIVT